MWVIYNTETGNEFIRTEHLWNADNILKILNDNEYGTVFAKRWEE